MSLLLSRYCTLLLPELQASEDSHGAFILRTWSSMSVLSIRFRYYMSAHDGPSSYSKSPASGKFASQLATAGGCPHWLRRANNSPHTHRAPRHPALKEGCLGLPTSLVMKRPARPSLSYIPKTPF